MQAINSSWAPDESLFDEINGEMRGVFRVKEALEEAGVDLTNIILTSHDPVVIELYEKLRINNMPDGFSQSQMPVLMLGGNTMSFLTFGLPNKNFPEHRHTRDNGLRVIISGSIFYKNIELVAGDWMYVPRGASYSFVTGASGCIMFHLYDSQ